MMIILADKNSADDDEDSPWVFDGSQTETNKRRLAALLFKLIITNSYEDCSQWHTAESSSLTPVIWLKLATIPATQHKHMDKNVFNFFLILSQKRQKEEEQSMANLQTCLTK